MFALQIASSRGLGLRELLRADALVHPVLVGGHVVAANPLGQAALEIGVAELAGVADHHALARAGDMLPCLAGTLIGSVTLELPETGNHRSRSDLIQSDIEISSPSLRS